MYRCIFHFWFQHFWYLGHCWHFQHFSRCRFFRYVWICWQFQKTIPETELSSTIFAVSNRILAAAFGPKLSSELWRMLSFSKHFTLCMLAQSCQSPCLDWQQLSLTLVISELGPMSSLCCIPSETSGIWHFCTREVNNSRRPISQTLFHISCEYCRHLTDSDPGRFFQWRSSHALIWIRNWRIFAASPVPKRFCQQMTREMFSKCNFLNCHPGSSCLCFNDAIHQHKANTVFNHFYPSLFWWLFWPFSLLFHIHFYTQTSLYFLSR